MSIGCLILSLPINRPPTRTSFADLSPKRTFHNLITINIFIKKKGDQSHYFKSLMTMVTSFSFISITSGEPSLSLRGCREFPTSRKLATLLGMFQKGFKSFSHHFHSKLSCYAILVFAEIEVKILKS